MRKDLASNLKSISKTAERNEKIWRIKTEQIHHDSIIMAPSVIFVFFRFFRL